MNDRELMFILRARDEASAAVERARSSLGGLGDTAKKVGLAVGVALAGIGTAVSIAGFGFNSMRQQAQLAFETMLGSGEKATVFLDELQAFAAKTPFEFPELVSASQKLLAMGFSAEQVLPTLTSIGDAVSGLGGSSALVDQVTRAMGQMQAKGKIATQEMMQLTEAGIPSWRFLAEAIGVSIPEAMKLVEQGAVSSSVGIKALTDGMNKNFGGLMDKQSKTAAGLMSTLKDTFSQVSGAVMMPFFEMASAGLSGLADWISSPAFTQGAKAVADGFRTVVTIAGEIFGVLTGKAPDAGAALTGALGPGVAREIMGAVALIRTAVTTVFTFISENIMPKVTQALQFMRENWDSVAFALKVLIAGVIVPAFVAWAVAAAAAALATLVAMAPLLLVLAAVGIAAFLLHKNWDELVAGVKKGIEDWKAIFEAAGTAIVAKVAEVGQFFSDLGTRVTGALAAMGATIGGFFSTIGTSIRTFVDNALALWKMFTDNPPRMIGIMIGLVIGSLLNLAKGIGDFTGAAAQAFLTWVDTTKTTVVNFFTALPGQVGAGLASVWATLVTFAGDALVTMQTWVSNIGTAIGTFFSELPSRVGGWLQSVIERFGQWREESVTATTGTVEGIGKVLSDFFTTLPGKMWEFAVNAVQGLIGGFGSMVGTITSTVQNLFGGIVSGVKAALGINSPSTVFKDIGQNMMYGLQAGLDSVRAPQIPFLDAGGLGRAPGLSAVGAGVLGSGRSGGGGGPLIGSIVINGNVDSRARVDELGDVIVRRVRARGLNVGGA